MLVEMTNCFVENDSVASISLSEISSSSSVSDRACVHWGKINSFLYNEPFRLPTVFYLLLLAASFLEGCVLSGSKTTAVFQAENDLLENQFFIKTVTHPSVLTTNPVLGLICPPQHENCQHLLTLMLLQTRIDFLFPWHMLYSSSSSELLIVVTGSLTKSDSLNHSSHSNLFIH